MPEPTEKKCYFSAKCPKCKKIRGVYEKPQRGVSKDGRKMLKGICWSCGRKLVKYIGKKKK